MRETVLPSAGLRQVLSNAALPSGVQGLSFLALVLRRAAASTIGELGLCCVCRQDFHAGEGCACIFCRAWVEPGLVMRIPLPKGIKGGSDVIWGSPLGVRSFAW